jgi:hypothetical protein
MKSWKWKRWPTAMAWWTFLLMLFSGLLTYVTWLQYNLGKDTQRAYIVVKPPTEGTINGRLLLRIFNTGQLPASEIKMTLYVARETFPSVTVFGQEKVCAEHKYDLAPGIENAERLRIELNPWNDADWQSILNRDQAVFVGVSLTYNDGVRKDAPIPYEWCTQSSYDSIGKELNWVICPAGQIQWLKDVTVNLPCQKK